MMKNFINQLKKIIIQIGLILVLTIGGSESGKTYCVIEINKKSKNRYL